MIIESVAQNGAFNLDAEINERRRQLSNIRQYLITTTPNENNRLGDEIQQQLIMNCAMLAHGLDQPTAQECIARVDEFVADMRTRFGGAE